MSNNNDEKSRLDSAARAAWLYFIGEKTQEEIARIMRISRPTAQRLVSLARSERLITFRFKNPILSYLELADRLTSLYRLAYCEVVPVDPTKPESLAGVATSAAGFIELSLSAPTQKPCQTPVARFMKLPGPKGVAPASSPRRPNAIRPFPLKIVMNSSTGWLCVAPA